MTVVDGSFKMSSSRKIMIIERLLMVNRYSRDFADKSTEKTGQDG